MDEEAPSPVMSVFHPVKRNRTVLQASRKSWTVLRQPLLQHAAAAVSRDLLSSPRARVLFAPAPSIPSSAEALRTPCREQGDP